MCVSAREREGQMRYIHLTPAVPARVRRLYAAPNVGKSCLGEPQHICTFSPRASTFKYINVGKCKLASWHSQCATHHTPWTTPPTHRQGCSSHVRRVSSGLCVSRGQSPHPSRPSASLMTPSCPCPLQRDKKKKHQA